MSGKENNCRRRRKRRMCHPYAGTSWGVRIFLLLAVQTTTTYGRNHTVDSPCIAMGKDEDCHVIDCDDTSQNHARRAQHEMDGPVDDGCNLSCEQDAPCISQENGVDTCDCPKGYVGLFCEIECRLECLNGGTCEVDGEENEACHCPVQTSGELCEIVEEEAFDEITQAPTLGPTMLEDVDMGANEASPTTNNNDVACPLFCQNGGNCDLDSSMGEPKCFCPPEYAGDLCETIKEVPCGSGTCYHGSQCVSETDGGLSYCDCTTIDNPQKHYAGTFCQYEATLYCPNKQYFCVNGGKCKDEGAGKFSCLCPDEWTGPSCEFERQIPVDSDEKDTNGDCKLTCLNGGTCRKGQMAFAAADGIGPDLGGDNLLNSDSERCLCPQGFTGGGCEFPYEECGNGEHMCLTGSKCVPPQDEGQPWTCECANGAGNTCNRHSTSECVSPDTKKSIYRGMESLIMCVNDGVCTTYEQDGRILPACKCPSRYTGPHCEFLRDDYEANIGIIEKSSSKESAVGPIIGVLVSITLAIFAIVMIRRRTKVQSSRQKTGMIEFAHIQEESFNQRSPSMDEVAFDDMMEEVELM